MLVLLFCLANYFVKWKMLLFILLVKSLLLSILHCKSHFI